jgi:hypothetical protein
VGDRVGDGSLRDPAVCARRLTGLVDRVFADVAVVVHEHRHMSDVLVEALERIAQQQQQTLAMIERNGFVFTDLGHAPGNWQHLAFTIYTDLCEVDSIARAALAQHEDLP